MPRSVGSGRSVLRASYETFDDQGLVARSMVSAIHWLSSIKTTIIRLPWYLTLFSANQASSNAAPIKLEFRTAGFCGGRKILVPRREPATSNKNRSAMRICVVRVD